MRSKLIQRPGRFFLAVAIISLSSACAEDPATRIERAREHQANSEYRAAIIELKNVLREDTGNADVRALLGELSLQNGDSTTAIKELRRAQELGASADVYAVSLARALIRESRNEEAVKLNPDSMTEIKNRATLLALVGMAEFNLDNQRAADRNFAAALELDPAQPDALRGRAKLAISRGDLGAAETGLQAMLQSTPGDPAGLVELARIQFSKGDHAAAEENYKKALSSIEGTRRASERLQYLAGLIDVLIAQNKAADAQSFAAKMLRISDKHPLALFQSARADYEAGDYDGAIDKAGRLITVSPASEPPRLLLAGAALAKGDTSLSATHLQIAVQNNPGNGQARKLLARVRLKQGDSSEALALLAPMVAAGSTDPQLLTMAGTANIESGNQQAGLALVERGLELGIDDQALMLQTASSVMASGDVDRAIEILESIPATESVGQRELMLILALLKKDDKDAALAMAKAAVDARPDSAEAHSLLATFYLAAREYDKARSEYQKSLELGPGNMMTVVNLARVDVAQKKPEQAKARFNAILKTSPGNLLALTSLAELEESTGNVDASVAALEQARKTNPDAVEPPLRLARYYLSTGNLLLAEERADQVIRAAPLNADGFLVLGQALLKDGRSSEALGHLETAVELAPKAALAHYYFGRALAVNGQDENSLNAFRTAAELDTEFFPARVALVNAAIQRDDFKLAMETTDESITEFPDRAEPLVLRAAVQRATNDLGGALESYRKAAEINPSKDLVINIYKIRKSLGEKEPWKEIKEWVEKTPDDASARTTLATAYFDSGEYQLASSNLEQVMKTQPDTRVAMTLAEISRKTGDIDSAIGWLQKAVELGPAEMQSRSALATMELQRGNNDIALKLLRELRKDFPDAMELNVLEGDVYLAAGNYRKSIEAYDAAFAATPSEFLLLKQYHAKKQSGDDDAWKLLEKWFADHPGHVNTGLQLAEYYTNREWTDQAVATYEKVLAAAPDNHLALNNIAWAYLTRANDGDVLRGLAAASKAYDKAPHYAAIGDTFGWILLQDGQNKRAEEVLAKAASQPDAIPEIVYHHAVALDALGRDKQALTLLNSLLRDNKAFDSRDDAEALQRRLSP